MRVFGAIVPPLTALMTALDPELADRRTIRAQVVGDHSIGNEAVFLEKLAHQFQRGALVPLGLDQHVKHLTLRIDSAPEVDHAAGDFQIRLIQMPGAVWLCANRLRSRDRNDSPNAERSRT